MRMNNSYDVIVIGAGVGGLAAATLVAKDGRKVLLLERTDRVGGRAMSIKGEEISGRGAQWYKDLLATQYSYIADSSPDLDTLIKKRMLDGYTLDIGYHAISSNGVGYMLDFEELAGGIEGVDKLGAHYASYYKGELYRDLAGSRIDPRLKDIAKSEGINYLQFYVQSFKLSEEELDALEKVSYQQWAEQMGITKNDIIFNHLHTVSTLFSTINNPSEISMGDILRYFKHAINPKIPRGLTNYVGGFVKNGTIEWSKAVARKFESLGGELMLNTKVKEIRVEEGKVKGVLAEVEGKEAVEFRADTVISNVPAQHTFRIIDEKYFPREWVNHTKSMYGYGSYVPYMGLKKLVIPEDQALLGIKNTCVIPKEEGFDWDVYICWNIQSMIDKSVAPEGKYLYTAYLPITEKESLDKTLVQKLIKRLPQFMEDIYPGFIDSIEWKLDLVCWKLEGVAKSISQAGTQKVPVRSSHVPGLFFAGDTAKGYGVAMDCAIISGVLCASEVLGKDFGVK
jgi:phytoene dehydrogenase-like protein